MASRHGMKADGAPIKTQSLRVRTICTIRWFKGSSEAFQIFSLEFKPHMTYYFGILICEYLAQFLELGALLLTVFISHAYLQACETGT
jgi:hypothetical protein